jgi:CRISPR-associated protein Cmr1
MAVLIEASYRLTTPLFCGGADSEVAELRLPSFKGVLRFWWRALAWSRCGGDLAQIQQEEEQLFGSTRTGQAQVLMRLVAANSPELLGKYKVLTVAKGDRQVVGMGARYLGYGLMEAFDRRNAGLRAGQLGRDCLGAPLDFTVQLRSAELGAHQHSLLQALIALGTLGGMGSRSRRGYGSLVIRSLTVDGESPRLASASERWRAPRDKKELAAAIAELQRQANRSGLPEYTALSSDARHVVLTADDCREPLDLLDRIGREMVRFRSWGKDGWILDRQAEREEIFEPDHRLMIITQPKARASHPARIAFGLPHNYRNAPAYKVGPADRALNRRASPLFIHLHQCGSKPVAVLSFLPALFLPKTSTGDLAQISVGRKEIPQQSEEELYWPIRTFLDRLLDLTPRPYERKERFTTAWEVETTP